MTSSIMGYNPGPHVAGTASNTIVADALYQVIMTFGFGLAGNSGLRKFDAYPHGAELLARTITDMALAGITQPACVTQGGLICFPRTTTNSATIYMVRESDFKLQQQFGVSSGSLGPSTSTNIQYPYSLHSHRSGGVDYLVTTSLVSSAEVNSLNLTTNLNTNTGNVGETIAVPGGAPSQSPGATVTYVLGKGNYTVTHSATPLGLYTVVGTVLTRIGSITPANIDATWSHFIFAAGLAVDQTDGNPIIQVGTDDAVTNKQYLVKLNKATAAVIWALPITSNDAFADFDMRQCNITRQIMYYFSGTTLYTINTATGAATTATIGSPSITGAQFSEDVSGSIFYFGSWSETTTHPNYLGDYMGNGGNHAPSNIWFRFFPGPTITPPPTPPNGDPSQSRKRAWTFTLDGHTFYVLDLGQEGTWLYDADTGQWCQWVTANFVQWDVANGCMWDKRVVGGDLQSTQVWEARNSQLTDNGTDIQHIVSGKLETRSRVFHSVAALRLSGSLGEIGDPASATVNVRYSDDDGFSYSQLFPVTIIQGSANEIAWRSMGSFCAPGRVFEISDTGGLVRIDGLDAFIDDFDEDSNTEATQGGGGGG